MPPQPSCEFHKDLVSATSYQAMARYEPREYQGDIHLIMASARQVDEAKDTRHVWRNLVSGQVSVVEIEAEDSGRMLLPPHVDALAEYLTSAIDADRNGAFAGDGSPRGAPTAAWSYAHGHSTTY